MLRLNLLLVMVATIQILPISTGRAEGAPKWNPETVEAELKRLEPVMKALGIKTPLRRARKLVDKQRDGDWNKGVLQRNWQSRIDYWRYVMLGEDGGAPWNTVLDLSHKGLTAQRRRLETGGDAADKAWTDYIRKRAGLGELMSSSLAQKLLFEGYSWDQFDADGNFRMELAEEQVKGKVRLMGTEPVDWDPDGDYDWALTHPVDRRFAFMQQEQYHTMSLGLATLNQPDDRWVRLWVHMMLTFIDQCPRLAVGQLVNSDGKLNEAWTYSGATANRLRYLILNYLAMKDSKILTPQLHGVMLRMIRQHAVSIDELGQRAYNDNYMVAAGKSMFLMAALLPEVRLSDHQVEKLFKYMDGGMRKEVLDDGVHIHRSFAYHIEAMADRLLGIAYVADKMGMREQVPESFLAFLEKMIQAFAHVSTPIRSTPGINDDWLTYYPHHHSLKLAAGVFRRDDWLYMGSDGRQGKAPRETSVLLPAAGLAVMRSDWTAKARYAIFNLSPGAGHNHPDSLTLQIWVGDRHLLLDPSVGHYYTGEREISKRSWWHSCPTLGKSRLSVNNPKIVHWQTTTKLDTAVGEIQVGKATFRRHLFFVDRAYWVIWDEFENFEKFRAGTKLWENFHFVTTQDTMAISEDGRQVRTTFRSGANLAMFTGQPGWTLKVEKASRWMKYGGRPVPTTVLHYQAEPGSAAQGFAALFVVQDGPKPLKNTGISRIERLADGRVKLHVMVRGKKAAVTTVAAK